MSFFIADALAEAPAAAAAAQPNLIESLIFPIGLFAVFYFFFIRPQMKRQKDHKKLIEALGKGDEVQTEGGLLGRIVELSDDYARIEVADNVVLVVRRSSVQVVLPKGTLKEI
ncbi:MAG: preprotein translocase subunit YajC [Gammaproteobacteria bacterium]|nr:preprotein translocase subunit YajC [Gammaproteobacteria bacterium]MBU1655817.1 preprotein translocase subunit YajC [Gammaproteobacteria bacterium]MBU1962397.1 preprotein translocase subunit YajC [Gammaproteobacteria bacterium]